MTMLPHFDTEHVTVWHGDCIDVMRDLPDASVDAVVTDPPYGLEFMGREWDGADGFRRSLNAADVGRENTFGRMSAKAPEYRAGKLFQDWCELWATEALRVLKPGGHLLAFGGTRTFHRLTAGIEDAGFEIRDSIAWLYGSGFPKSHNVAQNIEKKLTTGIERRAQEKRGATGDVSFDDMVARMREDPERGQVPITTPDAARWQGWGTALKPSHEPVVVARKPLQTLDTLAVIGSHLDRLEAECRHVANGAGPSSAPTRPASPAAKTATAPAPAATKVEAAPEQRTATGVADGSPAQTATSPSASPATTSSNIVSSWSGYWAELCEATSTSTTAITSDTTTVLRTLSSSIASLTATNMLQPDPTRRPGLTSTASAVDALFASAVYASRATHALSAAAPATSPTPPNSRDAAGSAFEPIVVARKPLTGTVAANVLAYGTGALNIDASRIPMSTEDAAAIESMTGFGKPGSIVNPDAPAGFRKGTPHSGAKAHTQGRWPANVVLSADQAAALDQQSGVLTSGALKPYTEQHENASSFRMDREKTYESQANSGGASRFFKTVDDVTPRFMYTAKAGSGERPKVEREGGGNGRVTGLGGKVRQCNVCGTRAIESGAVSPSCGHEDFFWADPTTSTTDTVSHPTVKPLDLMRWLVKLVTPKGGTILEPFAGSGTTVEAAVLEGFRCIAIEREADYLPLIMQRVSKPHAVGLDFGDWEDAS